jgi:hypothetical protein
VREEFTVTSLTGKRCLVTAAAQGCASVIALARGRRARVVAADINVELLSGLARLHGIETQPLDVLDTDVVNAWTVERP